MKNMKQQTIIIIATTIFTITGVLILTGDFGLSVPNSSEVTRAQSVQTAVTAPPSLPASTVGLPTRLTIPKIKVNAFVQHVGTTITGNMDTPSNETDVAWYMYGVRPGDLGNAVIAGHLDTIQSRFGVFKNLHSLDIGEDVFMTDDKGKQHHFRVIKKVSYEYNKAPVQEIFAPLADKAYMNLITCSGTWLKKARTYSHRTVVYTELIP